MPEVKDVKEVEVEVPVMTTGKLNFLNKAGFNNPAPDWLVRIFSALKYTFVSIITAVSATDLFTGHQVKVICFTLGIFIIVLGSIQRVIGVEPVDETLQNKI